MHLHADISIAQSEIASENKRMSTLRFLIISLLCVLALGAAWAQSVESVDALEQTLTEQAVQVENFETQLGRVDTDLDELSDAIRDIRPEFRAALDQVDRQVDLVREEADILAPDETGVSIDEVARADALKRLARARLLQRQAQRQYDAIDRILGEISTVRRDRLLGEITTRGTSGLAPSMWARAWSKVSLRAGEFSDHIRQWISQRQEGGRFGLEIASVLGAMIGAIILFWPIRAWANETFLNALQKRRPTPVSRALGLILRMVFRMAPGVIGGLIVLEALRYSGFLVDEGATVARALWHGLLLILFAEALTTSVFAPRLEAWRIIPVSTDTARRARLYTFVAALALALDLAFSSSLSLADATGAIVQAGRATTTLALLGLLYVAGGSGKWTLAEARAGEVTDSTKSTLSFTRKLLRPAVLLTLAAWIAGFQTFAHFAVTRTVLFAFLVLGTWILRDTVQSLLSDLDRRASRRTRGDDAPQETVFGFWGGVVADGLLLLLIAPLAMLIFGQSWSDVRGIMADAFEGVSVGGIRFSLSEILAAAFVFAVVLGGTRLIQIVLDRRLFSTSRADQGFRNSFRTLLGYLGLVIATIMAISVAGLDLSNLAIVAGALSVGIGFGLQSIVNNFVSGLILLFERPIKVGDWIVTASGEGFVKKIKIRSTEIETFENAAIIVPNSELISSAVQNWTLKDKRRRISVDVGVHYKSDPKKVHEVLMDVARKSQRVMSYPAPFVLFKGFGDSSLDFEVRVFINNVDDRFTVQNDLRIEIFSRFLEEGIEIPYPQRDVHIIPPKGPESSEDS